MEIVVERIAKKETYTIGRLYLLADGDELPHLAPNRQHTYMVAGRPWTPRNANHSRYGQMVTLKWGLQQMCIRDSTSLLHMVAGD